MTTTRPRASAPRRNVVILGVAAAGLALGHRITYSLGVPDAHARIRVLADTGHGYLGLATQLAVVAGVAALAIVFAHRLTRRDSAAPGCSTFLWLAGFQVAAFASVEVLERLVTGAPVDHLLHTGIMPIGLVVQVALAGLGALLLSLLLKAADTVAAAISDAIVISPRDLRVPMAPQLLAGPATALVGPSDIRGPPHSSSS
jgi:hypothetical protein